MFRSILVPVDGSSFSEQALPLAEMVGKGPTARVHIGHVFVPFAVDQSSEGPLAQVDQDGAWKDKERYLDGLVEKVKAAGVGADRKVLEGTVIHAIEGWAHETEADLIVMATHGRAGLKRLRLGSIAESLVSRALAPMLLLHPAREGTGTPTGPIRKVVVALDRSDFAHTIVEPLEKLGASAGVESYTLVHVADSHGVGKAGWAPLTAIQSRAEEDLSEVRSRLAASGAKVDVKVVAAPDAADGILGVAEDVGADLIAMTTHGMTGVRPALLGSVAAKVLHSWEGPILLHRPS